MRVSTSEIEPPFSHGQATATKMGGIPGHDDDPLSAGSCATTFPPAQTSTISRVTMTAGPQFG